jgi:3-isopropylmalate dehydrogenase
VALTFQLRLLSKKGADLVSDLTIAVLPGDGIGPEITHAALTVLRAVRSDLNYVEARVGAAAIDADGTPYPEATRQLLHRSVAVLFGSVGDPRYDGKPVRPEQALLAIRKEFDLFANIRPVKVLPGLESASTLKPEIVTGIDLVVLRELTSGLYFGEPKQTSIIDGVETAVDTLVYRAPEIERIVRAGFELARTRRNKLTSVDKQNVLETGRLWRRVVLEVAKEYPDVQLDHLLVDNAAMQLVRNPKQFDVMVTENTFGDILSDEAAMLTGSIGNLPSASLGPVVAGREFRFGFYEPISGSAPDIAGQGIANPTAAILSAAMLCRHSLNDETSAARIERAVESAIASGARTRDMAAAGQQTLSTTEFTAVVMKALTTAAVG